LKWYGRSFRFFLCIKINPYPIQSMVLYCVPVVMSLSLRICSYHQRIFLFFLHFYCILLSYPFLWYKYYFFFLLLVHYLYIKIFSDLTLCQCVYDKNWTVRTKSQRIYIYIYIFKETWLNCIFTFQNRFLIIVQFEKLLMDFFEMKHYLLRLKSLRNTVIQVVFLYKIRCALMRPIFFSFGSYEWWGRFSL